MSCSRAFIFMILSLVTSVSPYVRADVVEAESFLKQGRVEDSNSILRSWLGKHPSDSRAHLLLCRVFYAQQRANAAVLECESAATGSPNSSDIELWLGRAYGMKASTANPLLAFSVARKARDAFEMAVRLEPSNAAAVSDLGEFYVAAPSVVGGGSDKARELADRLRTQGPDLQSRSHRILGMLAEKQKDFSTAETEFGQSTAGNLPDSWIDLGAFYSRRKQPDLAVAAIQKAVDLDQERGAILVDAANVLTEANRSPELARQLLREYISSPNTTDAAPVFKVHRQLGDLLARAGDLASATKEYDIASGMAPSFRAKRKPASPRMQPGGR